MISSVCALTMHILLASHSSQSAALGFLFLCEAIVVMSLASTSVRVRIVLVFHHDTNISVCQANADSGITRMR